MLACAYLKLHAIIRYHSQILYITYIFLLLFRFEVTPYSFGTVYKRRGVVFEFLYAKKTVVLRYNPNCFEIETVRILLTSFKATFRAF